MADKSYRIPISETQQQALADMLRHVSSRKVVHYDWTSEHGRAFINAVREVQLAGVPMPWIAEALDISLGTLNGAIDYYARPSSTRRGPGRKKPQHRIPLRKSPAGGDAKGTA